jgi:hypothetical protein
MKMLEDTTTRSSRPAGLVTTRSDEGVLMVTVEAERLGQLNSGELASICLGYADPGGGGWLFQAVSLGLVREVDCAGLRALVQISDSLSAAGGKLIVFGVPQAVRTIVRRTGLSGRLALARGAREAVRLASPGEETARTRRLAPIGRPRAA